MALTGEDLMAISELLDARLKSELAPIKKELKDIRLHLELETDKKIQILAENYVPAAARFEITSSKIDTMQADIDILKKVVAGHTERLEKLEKLKKLA